MTKEDDRTRPESPPGSSAAQDFEPCCPTGTRFEIRVRGHLDSKWSDWLEGMQVELLENGEMVLTGPIEDQSAMLGILNKLVLLNLTLISINPIKTEKE